MPLAWGSCRICFRSSWKPSSLQLASCWTIPSTEVVSEPVYTTVAQSRWLQSTYLILSHVCFLQLPSQPQQRTPALQRYLCHSTFTTSSLHFSLSYLEVFLFSKNKTPTNTHLQTAERQQQRPTAPCRPPRSYKTCTV